MVTSNGFQGDVGRTSFSCAAEATAKDEGDKRPADWWSESHRHRDDLTDPAAIGRRAVERALRRVGADRMPTEELPLVVENRAAGRLLRFFSAALFGGNLQQRRSFLEGKLGEQVTAAELTVTDDPFIPRARGSRLFDNEGLAAKKRAIIEQGVLKNFYIDSYYARKLDMPATTGYFSNLVFTSSERQPQSPAAWMKELGRGILVTGFIGGNSNSSTGDFSTGIQGFLFEDGEIGRPLAAMNIAGNHLEFWHRLVGLGDDPYPFSSVRIPTLVFDKTLVAGA
jgi:PmbA protein